MVRLLTHQLLQCHVKQCTQGFPLRITEYQLHHEEKEWNMDFLTRLLPKLDWEVLKCTAHELNLPFELPATIPSDATTNEDFLKLLHHILLEYDIVSGVLVCPGCGHVYPVRDSIPNMLLTEKEV